MDQAVACDVSTQAPTGQWVRALHSVECCPVCSSVGRTRYEGLRDTQFGVPGAWRLRRCSNRHCGHLWLDPRPRDEDIPALYADYHTHRAPNPISIEDGCNWRAAARRVAFASAFGYDAGELSAALPLRVRLLAASGFLRDRVGRSVMWLPLRKGARLLDYGCGAGAFLARMKALGWEVCGFDPDPRAAAATARDQGVQVFAHVEALLRLAPFDAITLSHVIEHLPDPVRTLAELAPLLEDGGRLVVATPNANSLGHAVFGRHWRGLEAPRHLSVFSPASLAQAVRRAGYTLQRVFTLSAMAPLLTAQSAHAARSAGAARHRPLAHPAAGRVVELLESLPWISSGAGEEAAVIATR